MSLSILQDRTFWTGPTLQRAGLVIAALSALVIAGAWGFEYAGYAPCALCLEERIPYYAAIPGGLFAAWLAGREPRLAAIVLAAISVAFLYNFGLSIYHAGAEWKFWPGPETCGVAGDLSASKNLLKSLQQNKSVRCDEAAIRILGLSLAGYNVLISGALAAFGGFSLYRSRIWQS